MVKQMLKIARTEKAQRINSTVALHEGKHCIEVVEALDMQRIILFRLSFGIRSCVAKQRLHKEDIDKLFSEANA